jgi:hypothetical protein
VRSLAGGRGTFVAHLNDTLKYFHTLGSNVIKTDKLYADNEESGEFR